MRQHKPIRLSDLDAERTAEALTWAVYQRAQRDARRLGMAFGLPAGLEPKTKVWTVLNGSQVHKVSRAVVAWAMAGRGNPEMVLALREIRADLEGVEPGDASREPDLSTIAGVVVVAATARLALAEGRAIEAVEVATLASVDERSIRSAAAAGALPPVGPGRPMRFAASVVCQYLYGRGVAGFAAPSAAAPTSPG